VTEGELERGFLIRARVIGPKYGTQQSVIDDIVDDHVSMAVVLLHRQDREYAQQAVGAVSDADQAVNALGDLATHLARAAGTETEGPRSTARDLAFGELESPYRMWLESLAGGDPMKNAWRGSARCTRSSAGSATG
jgi:CRISPR system Cascade subunit CasA